MIYILWLIFAVLVAYYANKYKGHSRIKYFFISLFLSPVIGLLIAMLVIPNAAQFEKSELSREESSKCPYCAELMKSEVVTHRYCCSEIPIAIMESYRKENDKHSEQFALAFNLVNDNSNANMRAGLVFLSKLISDGSGEKETQTAISAIKNKFHSVRLHELAYDSYYKDKDNDIAKPLYELVTIIYPESKEAEYSKTQLKKFAA